MSDRGILVFAYDGSIEGFYSCVFEAFLLKALPTEIVMEEELMPTLLKVHHIETDLEHAKRVENGILNRLGEQSLRTVRTAFLFDGENKEMSILLYIWKAFKEGKSTNSKIDDETVNRVFKMCVAVNYEAERLRQFTRFEDYNGALVAEIHPKHFVLPLIRGFFCNRIKNENFMIYDVEHKAALIHASNKTAIIPLENLELPSTAEDKFYAGLWKSYYRHIAIASRYNPTCRRAHMPKRFWQYLPEVQEELEPGFVPKLSFGGTKQIAESLKEERKKLAEKSEA